MPRRLKLQSKQCTCCNACQLHNNYAQNQVSIYEFSRNVTVHIALYWSSFTKRWLPILARGRHASYHRFSTWRNSKVRRLNTRQKLQKRCHRKATESFIYIKNSYYQKYFWWDLYKNIEESHVGTLARNSRCGKSETCFNQSEGLRVVTPH